MYSYFLTYTQATVMNVLTVFVPLFSQQIPTQQHKNTHHLLFTMSVCNGYSANFKWGAKMYPIHHPRKRVSLQTCCLVGWLFSANHFCNLGISVSGSKQIRMRGLATWNCSGVEDPGSNPVGESPKDPYPLKWCVGFPVAAEGNCKVEFEETSMRKKIPLV